MASYKYDTAAISADIDKLRALANSEAADLSFDTQSTGGMINKVQEFAQQLNELHRALNNLVGAAATATKITLDSMLQLDGNFAEITEESSYGPSSPLHVEILDE